MTKLLGSLALIFGLYYIGAMPVNIAILLTGVTLVCFFAKTIVQGIRWGAGALALYLVITVLLPKVFS